MDSVCFFLKLTGMYGICMGYGRDICMYVMKMSRWSEEEDASIVGLLQDVTDGINYDEATANHNTMFKKERTTSAYHTRAMKLAKENGIDILSRKRWTEDEKERLVEMVKENPCNPDWKKLANDCGRSEKSIHSMYNEIVNADEHAESCVNRLNEGMIREMMKKQEYTCVACDGVYYSSPSNWEGSPYCDACHGVKYGVEIEERWRAIGEYEKERKKDKCKICDVSVEYAPGMRRRFHFDHKNMFQKTDSIYSMIRDGTPLVEIYREIDRCEAMCISCHAVVTMVERHCGFQRMKQGLTRESKTEDGKDPMKEREAMERYERCMYPVYEMVRVIVGSSF